jgi:2-hydroxy-3-keto-5-methylthiopentenyl-1-phosphate phosphatase
MIIAVDFDGTLCENDWPEIGEPNEELIDNLKQYQRKGVKIILWTCRVGNLLDYALSWCQTRGLIFDAVNENLPEIIEKFGSDTRKVYADIYIDDRATAVNLYNILTNMQISTGQYLKLATIVNEILED